MKTVYNSLRTAQADKDPLPVSTGSHSIGVKINSISRITVVLEFWRCVLLIGWLYEAIPVLSREIKDTDGVVAGIVSRSD